MRTEQEIFSDLQSAGKEYHENSQAMTVAAAGELANKIKGYQNELQAYFMDGVTLHEGYTWINAMRRNKSTIEIGGDVQVEEVINEGQLDQETVMVTKHIRSQGATKEEAVKNWNDKNFV